MEKEIEVVTITDENGEEFELEVLKEFNYKDKKYIVLYENMGCTCDEECECHHDEDECGDECTCDHDSDECDDECTCDHDSDECDDNCEEEGQIYLFEISKNDKGEEVFEEVDEKLMEEIIPIVEKELYEEEKED